MPVHSMTARVTSSEDEETFVVHGVPCHWTAYNLENGDYDATAEFRDMFNYGIQGPNSLKMLEALADHSLRDAEFMRSGPTEIAGLDVTAVRFGMSGEVGFELQGSGEHSEEVWDSILEPGEEYGIRRLIGIIVVIHNSCSQDRATGER